MLGRLAPGVAFASMAALVLVGCSPAEPEPSQDAVLAEARAAYEGFYSAIDEQMAQERASAEAFAGFASEELAAEWAGYVEAALDDGTRSQGVPTIVAIQLGEESSEHVDAALCVDGRSIQTTNADGSIQAPSELVAWTATFERSTTGGTLVLASLDPSQDQSICE
jgi:hypothetical protein